MSYGWRDVDGTFVEVCDECGFDARTVDDEAASFEAVFTALDELVAHENAERKPSEEIWSAREYVTHCIEVTEAILGYVTDRLGDEPAACPDLDASRAAVAARQASHRSQKSSVWRSRRTHPPRRAARLRHAAQRRRSTQS